MDTLNLALGIVKEVLPWIVTAAVGLFGAKRSVIGSLMRQVGQDLTDIADLLDNTSIESIRKILTDAVDTKDAIMRLQILKAYAASTVPDSIAPNPLP